ncbi:MAG: hypothetical protein E6917_20090, partial [Clostridium botulinum]|nr:hypothetical protein [Clostridium botulinum]
YLGGTFFGTKSLDKITKGVKGLISGGKAATINSLDDIARYGLNSLDDIIEKAGIQSVDDLTRIGVTSAEDLAKLGVNSVDDLAKLGINNIDELSKLGILPEDLSKAGIKGAGNPSYTSFRDLMSPDEVARYDKHWTRIAERISNEALDNQINFVKNGSITKPGGGAYKPAKISAAVDMNTGGISFGYNGANKFNPSRNTLKPELQSLIDNTKSLAANDLSNPYAARNSYELWSVDNCAEVYATNNALRSGANIDNIFLNTKYFNNRAYAEPCANCKVTFKDFSMLNK